MFRPRPRSLRRGLAGLRTSRKLSPVACDPRLGDRRLFALRQAQALPRQRGENVSAQPVMDADDLKRQGYSVAALRRMAQKRLPRIVFDMVDGAAGDEITMRRNEAALAAIELMPKVLAGAPRRDQSVEL